MIVMIDSFESFAKVREKLSYDNMKSRKSFLLMLVHGIFFPDKFVNLNGGVLKVAVPPAKSTYFVVEVAFIGFSLIGDFEI